ncbi:MAG: hypothetical protein AABX34_02730 [Nanoarchaeota archaeon]
MRNKPLIIITFFAIVLVILIFLFKGYSSESSLSQDSLAGKNGELPEEKKLANSSLTLPLGYSAENSEEGNREKQEGPDKKKIHSEVWSQNSPQGESYEFKVNCFGDYPKLEDCFLYNLSMVAVVAPDGKKYQLNKDFNINSYSGEVTRRWVLYGPEGGNLPISGNYTFEFAEDGKVILADTIEYIQNKISFPTGIMWERKGNDLYVEWVPPAGVEDSMWYKVIAWNLPGTPQIFISKVFSWDAQSALLENVTFTEMGNYSLNVAIFFKEGYAYSNYTLLTW